jgi:hypothetical protein
VVSIFNKEMSQLLNVLNASLRCWVSSNQPGWKFQAKSLQRFQAKQIGAAAVGADGTIYFAGYGDGGECLFGWTTDGNRTSTTVIGSAAACSPAIGREGVVYISACSGPFRAFVADTGGLARSAWPKFRGDAAQTGRAHAQ